MDVNEDNSFCSKWPWFDNRFDTMSLSWVFGIAAGYAFLANRVLVACSYAYPKPIKSKSEKAVPKKAKPNGTPGAGYTISGPEGRIVTFSGKNPSGTRKHHPSTETGFFSFENWVKRAYQWRWGIQRSLKVWVQHIFFSSCGNRVNLTWWGPHKTSCREN